jgi:hypothetical protein
LTGCGRLSEAETEEAALATIEAAAAVKAAATVKIVAMMAETAEVDVTDGKGGGSGRRRRRYSGGDAGS